MKPKIVAIIPARGGSKRIPRKNIKNFLGQPILKYSIDAALNAGCFDEIMVSTDDTEISEIAKSAGASVPFLRSEETSNDTAGLADVIVEVINSYKKMGKQFDYFCCIFSTAPFISEKNLVKAYDELVKSDADGAMAVMRFSFPIQRALKVKDGALEMFWPENYPKHSQELEASFHEAGQFFWSKCDNYVLNKNIFKGKTLSIEIPDSEGQDIDTEEDWKMAEMKYKILNNIK